MREKLMAVLLMVALVMTLAPCSFADSSIEKNKKKLKKVQSQKDDISEELDGYKKKIARSEKKLSGLEVSIEEKESQIRKTEAELNKTKKNIEVRRTGLNNRLRTMYKSGSIGYLDVVLGSNSIEELVTNVDLVQKIFSNDQNILTDLKSQKSEIQKKEKTFKEQKKDLASARRQERDAKEDLDETKEKLDKKLAALEKEENDLRQKIAEEAAKNGDVEYEGDKWQFPLKSSYTLTSHYGESRSYESHPGVDLAVPTGTPVYAAQSGLVTVSSVYGGYGNCVMIYHGNGLTSVYGHNSSLKVSKGQFVRRGQLVALAGSTGWSTGSHLHFEVRNSSGSPISPGPYIGVS
jgi:murein DD-endopeptidase MepM/ murein hydrolase activator NlpD